MQTCPLQLRKGIWIIQLQNSEYFEDYELDFQHPDSIHNTNTVIEKMSKDISDKLVAAESLYST
jgi:hypothetical protein